jgi:hypothetical protein
LAYKVVVAVVVAAAVVAGGLKLSLDTDLDTFYTYSPHRVRFGGGF